MGQETICPRFSFSSGKGVMTMRKFLLVAGVSAIALVGLSANQCSSDKPPEQAPQQPPAPQQQPPQPTQPPQQQ